MKSSYFLIFLLLVLISTIPACSDEPQPTSRDQETSKVQKIPPPVPKQLAGGPRAVLLVNDLPADKIKPDLPVIVTCILDIPETIIQDRRVSVTPRLSGSDVTPSSHSWQLLTLDQSSLAAAGSAETHWELTWQPSLASYHIGVDTTPVLEGLKVREARITVIDGKSSESDISQIRRRRLALLGQWNTLLPEINSALEKFPNDLQLHLSRVDALAGSGNPEKAYQELLLLIKQGQESFEPSAEHHSPFLPYWCIEYLSLLQSHARKSIVSNGKEPLIK